MTRHKTPEIREKLKQEKAFFDVFKALKDLNSTLITEESRTRSKLGRIFQQQKKTERQLKRLLWQYKKGL